MHLSVSGDVLTQEMILSVKDRGLVFWEDMNYLVVKKELIIVSDLGKVGVELASSTGGSKLFQDLTDTHHSFCLCMGLVFISFSTWQGPFPW